MNKRQLLKGNEALCLAAIDAGCMCFFGYPITPQNQVPEYLSSLMPKAGRVFLQAESELAAISMVYGAASAGVRVMTSSSSPGISLKQEGISYLAGTELPAVIINVVRGGPGLGNIAPAQSDYFQATRGGGHGDYRTMVLAPWSVQEMYDLTRDAFDLADKYRNPVLVLADALLGQMMEPAVTREPLPVPEPKPWGTRGTRKGNRSVMNSLLIQPDDLEALNIRMQEKYAKMAEDDLRWEETIPENPDLLFVAYGSSARICQSAITLLAEQEISAGLFRPITLYPYPSEPLRKAAGRSKRLMVVEMSSGQMIDDVRLAAECVCPISFYGRTGGNVFTPEELVEAAKKVL